MAEYVRRSWEPRPDGLTRQDRKGCHYDAYLADPLLGWALSIPGDLAADIADAERAITTLDQAETTHVSLEGLARFLLRAESVASSKIEGLDAGVRRLVEADAVLKEGGEPRDRIAVEILGNIDSMERAIDRATVGGPLGLTDLLDLHRLLMDRSPTPGFGGVMRREQNWIGGSSYQPCSSSFVPPPPEYVTSLMEDLVEYMNGDEHPALVQAAIAHAQFETIHPFADGNGRVGRALIHVVLRRRGLSSRFLPPISLVLATRAADYVAGLMAYRHVGPADGPERSTASQAWLRTFAGATLRSCLDAEAYASRIDSLVSTWRARIGAVRHGSATDLLMEVLPGVPLITVETAASLLERSEVAVGAAINRLAEAAVLKQRNIGKQRYRVFEAPEVFELFSSLERALATPGGDASVDRKVRPVPRG